MFFDLSPGCIQTFTVYDFFQIFIFHHKIKNLKVPKDQLLKADRSGSQGVSEG